MSQIRSELWIKCPIEGHGYFESACLNQSCKANRVQCYQCQKKGDHIAHVQDQKKVDELFEFFKYFQDESDSLISTLWSMIKEIITLYYQLDQELRANFQFSKKELLKMNAKEINQALDQVIKYDEIKRGLLEEVKYSSDNMIKQLKRNINELKLPLYQEINEVVLHKIEQSNDTQLINQEQVEKYYQKGNVNDQFRNQIILDHKIKSIIYYDDNYIEAIPQLSVALLLNSKHLDSLNTLDYAGITKRQLYRLIKLCQQIKSIQLHYIQKLRVQSDYVQKFYIRLLGDYENAIIWADKALSIDLMHTDSLYTKGESLDSINICQFQKCWINMKKLLRFQIKH